MRKRTRRIWRKGGEEEERVSFLCWCAVWHLSQDDDASALSGPDLLPTRRHLKVRQCCGPIRRENEEDRKLLRHKKNCMMFISKSPTLTLDDIRDELQVGADALDLVQAGQSLDGHVLVAVHLRDEVEVAAEKLPDSQWAPGTKAGRRTRRWWLDRAGLDVSGLCCSSEVTW